MRKLLALLEGPQTLGSGRRFWTGLGIVASIAASLPLVTDDYAIGNATYLLIWTFMALGLSLIWGYGGILSLGQTAFFGLGAYAYSVATTCSASTGFATLGYATMGIGVAAAGACLLGYFMFYGGIRDVFVGIVTLSVTLGLETFLSQTAGPEWHIGSARLNGFNGMSSMSPLSITWQGRSIPLEGSALFLLVLAGLIVVYLALRCLLNSRFGDALVGVRENRARAEALGIDARWYQTVAFTLAGALAGASGVLYASWGTYVTPSSMGLAAAAAPVIWVAVGGRGDLTAAALGTLLLQALSQSLAVWGNQYGLLLLGGLLVLTVRVFPQGIALWIADRLSTAREPSAPTGAATENPLR